MYLRFCPLGIKLKDMKKTSKTEKTENFWKEVLSWIEVFAAAAVIAFCINHFIIANSTVPTGSMEPTIMAGDRVFGSRLAYNNADPQRGDIVIFKWPDNESVYFVKRIIGLPGETVDIINGKVYINGSETPLEENYLAVEQNPEQPMHFEVPEGAYFMLGDNRNYSQDARYWNNTYVYRDKIIAKVLVRYWPSPAKIQ